MPTIDFESKLLVIGDWTLVTLPGEVSAELPSRGMTLVEGTINGYEFLTALEPDGNGSHWLKVDKQMLNAVNAKPGDTVKLSLQPSKAWPEPEIPADIQKGLERDPEAYEIWQDITPMARWDWIRWIRATNNLDTRANHIVATCSKLKHGIRRPCCFNRNMCTVPEVSKGGVLLGADPN